MSRSKWKGVFIDNNFLLNFLSIKNLDNKINDNNMDVIVDKDDVKLFDYKGNLRDSTIISSFIGYEFLVFNGRTYNSVIVNYKMVGFKFGDFSLISSVSIYKGKFISSVRKHKKLLRQIEEKKNRRERKGDRMLSKDD